MKNESDRRRSSRGAPTRCAWASTASSACWRTIPSDDVRYVPTIDEQIERIKKRHARPGPDALPRVPRRRSRRARGRRRLRALGGPADPGQDPRGLEGREAVRADRAARPARPQARARDDRDPRQGQRHLPRGPPDCRSRTAIPTIPALGRQLHPGRRRALVADRRPAPPEGRALLHGDVDVRRRSRSIPTPP